MDSSIQSQSRISRLFFGGGAISGEGGGYGFGLISETSAIELLQRAFHLGIRTFDTAPIYGFGVSENRIGKAFAHMRDQVQLITKGGVDWNSDQRVNLTNAPEVLERQLNESLQRLQTSYVDCYMIHWPDERVPLETSLDVLIRAQKEGKIRKLGLSNFGIPLIQQAQQHCQKSNTGIEYVQAELSFLKDANRELSRWCAQNHFHFMSWGSFDKGILTGRVSKTRQYDSADARSHAIWWKKDQGKTERMALAELLGKILNAHGISQVQWALSFNLDFASCKSVVFAPRTIAQLESGIEAVQTPLSMAKMEEIIAEFASAKESKPI